MPGRLTGAGRAARVIVIASQLGLAIILCAASQAAAATGITSGGSLVFTRAHNIWLTSADGATQRPLTTDGTANAPYRSPSQSADGSVVAMVRDRRGAGDVVVSSLYEVDREGTLLRAPFEPPQYKFVFDNTTCPGGTYGLTPKGIVATISPNGSKLAVEKVATGFFDKFCGSDGSFGSSAVYVVNLDGSLANDVIAPDPGTLPTALTQPSWVTNSRLVMHTHLTDHVAVYDLGSARAETWIAPSALGPPVYGFPALSANGLKLATTGVQNALAGVAARASTRAAERVDPPTGAAATAGSATITVAARAPATAAGGGTATTHGHLCVQTSAVDHQRGDTGSADPSLRHRQPGSPALRAVVRDHLITMAHDGAGVAWVEEGRDAVGHATTTSIYISPIGDIAAGSCGSINRQRLIDGGSDPSWGPAPIGPPGTRSTLPACPAGQPGVPPDCGAGTAKPGRTLTLLSARRDRAGRLVVRLRCGDTRCVGTVTATNSAGKRVAHVRVSAAARRVFSVRLARAQRKPLAAGRLVLKFKPRTGKTVRLATVRVPRRAGRAIVGR